MTLINCTSCAGLLQAGDRFCSLCGAEQRSGSGEVATDDNVVWDAVEQKLRAATEGKYRVRGLLGSGGMAAVFLADDIKLRRRVAIKVMSPSLMVDPHMVRRFTTEATTTAQFRHPNIVTVFDVDEGEGLHFFVMSFVAGRSLQGVIRDEGPLPPHVARHWVGQVASALAYAHGQGVVHRDIKPSNILIDHDGQALVADFGIAKVADQEGLTRMGTIVGTPAYVSPEQFLGAEATPASDQYALGVVGYEILTGAPPVTGSVATIYQARASQQDPVPLTSALPDCPTDLVEVIHRMLAKQPDDRWSSLPEVHSALGSGPLHHQDPILETLKELAVGRKSIASLDISSFPDSLLMGEEVQLEARPRDDTGRIVGERQVAWESSDAAVMTVTLDGIVRALQPGSATLIATSGGKSARVSLEVKEVSVDLVVVSPREITLPLTGEVEVKALVVGPGGQVLEGRPVEWAVADPKVATVTLEGVVEAIDSGTTTVTATAEGRVGTASLTVAVPVDAQTELVADAQTELVAAAPGGEAAEEETSQLAAATEAGEVAEKEAEEAPESLAATQAIDIGREVEESVVAAELPLSSPVEKLEKEPPAPVEETPAAPVVETPAAPVVETEEERPVLVPEVADGEAAIGGTIGWAAAQRAARPQWATKQWLPWVGGVAALAVVVAIATFGFPSATNVEGDGAEILSPLPSPTVLVATFAILPGDTVELQVGGQSTLEARASGPDGQRMDSVDVSWEAMNPQIAQISPDGVVRALTTGVAEIRALVGRGDSGDPVSDTVWVVVSAAAPPLELAGREPDADPEPDVVPPITRVVVNPELDTLRVADSLTLGATAVTAAGDPVGGQDIIWEVSDPDVARVEGTGAQVIVVAVSPGPILVRATIGGVEGEATLEVVATVTALTLSPAGGNIALGEPVTLRVADQDGGALDASFNSSDSSVATFSGSGVLQGLAPGEVTVVASAAGLSVQGVFTVVPPQPPELGADDRQADLEDPADEFRPVTEVDVGPEVLDPATVRRVADEEYPPLLRANGVGGTVQMRVFLYATGEVANVELLGGGSIYPDLNDAAMRVARVTEFTPAMLGGEAVGVLFLFELEFTP